MVLFDRGDGKNSRWKSIMMKSRNFASRLGLSSENLDKKE